MFDPVTGMTVGNEKMTQMKRVQLIQVTLNAKPNQPSPM